MTSPDFTGPRHGRRLPRWLLPTIGGGVLGVAALSVVLVMQASGSPACAAVPPLQEPPVAGTTHSGKATHFDGSGGGNCSYGPPSTDLYVALGPSEYSAGAACGGYIDVTGPKGSVRVKVVDQCPECAPGHLDLSKAAFSKIGNLSDGIIQITYKGVRDPALPGPIKMRVKDGASQYWLAILADNHGNPLKSVEVKTPSGGWLSLRRTDYNYWIDQDGNGKGPFTVRLTDVYGRQATVDNVTLSPMKDQSTGTMMYGAGAPAPNRTTASAKPPSAAPTTASPTAPAVPSASAETPSAEPSPWTSAEAAPLVGAAAPGRCRN
jgi:expansin